MKKKKKKEEIVYQKKKRKCEKWTNLQKLKNPILATNFVESSLQTEKKFTLCLKAMHLPYFLCAPLVQKR